MLRDSLESLKSALVAALPDRIITRDLLGFDQRKQSDLEAGVLTIVVSREGNYANYRGREADLGRLSVAVVGQLKLDEGSAPSEVENAEFTFAEQVKDFLKTVLPVEGIDLLETKFSGQLEAPYGWFVMDWEVWP